MTKVKIADRLSTIGTQYEVQLEDGLWARGTITNVSTRDVTVAFDRVYPVTVFQKAELKADIEQLLTANEARWVDKNAAVKKLKLKKAEKDLIKQMNEVAGATFEKRFRAYGLWKGRVASYVHERGAFQCVYEDGFTEYNTLKQLLKYNVSKVPRVQAMGTPSTKQAGRKKTPGTSKGDPNTGKKKASVAGKASHKFVFARKSETEEVKSKAGAAAGKKKAAKTQKGPDKVKSKTSKGNRRKAEPIFSASKKKTPGPNKSAPVGDPKCQQGRPAEKTFVFKRKSAFGLDLAQVKDSFGEKVCVNKIDPCSQANAYADWLKKGAQLVRVGTMPTVGVPFDGVIEMIRQEKLKGPTEGPIMVELTFRRPRTRLEELVGINKKRKRVVVKKPKQPKRQQQMDNRKRQHHFRVISAKTPLENIFKVPTSMHLASVIQIETEGQSDDLALELILGTKEGEAVPVELTYDRPVGLIHGRGPLDNQHARFIHADVAFRKKRYTVKEKYISDPLDIGCANHIQGRYTHAYSKVYNKKIVESNTKSVVSISSFGDSWPVTCLISDMAKHLNVAYGHRFSVLGHSFSPSTAMPFAVGCVVRNVTRCQRKNVLVLEFHTLVSINAPALMAELQFDDARRSDAVINDLLNIDTGGFGYMAGSAMQERQKQQLLAAREKEIKKHLFDVRKRNKTLLKLRKLATLAIKFSTYTWVLKNEGAEPAHRCQTTLMSQKEKNEQLFRLALDDLLYVEIPVAPKMGSATESYYNSVRLKSDELDCQYMDEAKKRRLLQLPNQSKIAKVGETVLADYGEEGLVKGKITSISFYSAEEISEMSASKRRKIKCDQENNANLTDVDKTGIKAIHVKWGDQSVEWIELPDPDIEINPPFCPPEKDNYSIPNLLDAIRPSATAPEYATPLEMKQAGTELLPYQKRFLHWGLEREGFLKPEKETNDVLDPRFTEIVLPNGKPLYLENETTDSCRLRERKVTASSAFPGGILAEEMGLGKTVEIIALMLANPAPKGWGMLAQDSLGVEYEHMKATLVVVPVILVAQWQTKLQRHAPNLNVVVMKPGERVDGWDDICNEYRSYLNMLIDTQVYSVPVRHRPGYVQFSNNLAMENDEKYRLLKTKVESFWENARGVMYKDNILYDNLGNADVCIVPFESFSHNHNNYVGLPLFCKGMNYSNAITAPRSKRAPSLYEILYGRLGLDDEDGLAPRKWWRVVLDEAQLVSNYNTVRSQLARKIITSTRWLVSGTPMNNTIEDLHGLLSCLGSSEIHTNYIWEEKRTLMNEVLIPFKDRQPVGLKRMKALLALSIWRHSKSRVQEEIETADFAKVGECEIIDVRLDFSPQEQLWYDELYKSVKSFLIREYQKGKNKKNVSGTQNERGQRLVLNPQTMSRLNELRQSCCHPQIVNRQHQMIGIGAVSSGRLPLQAIIKKMLSNSMARQNVEGDARCRYLKAISSKYGVDLGMATHGSGQTTNDKAIPVTTKGGAGEDEDDELSTCMICMDSPEVFVISKHCGHTACKECIDHWLLEECPHREKDDRYAKCPTCKQVFHASDLEEYSNTATITLKNNLLNPVDGTKIQASDNGTKINTVLKIMFEALQNDPSSKFVIFSQYKEMLDLTCSAIKASSLGIFEPVRLQFSNRNAKTKPQDDLNRFLIPYSTPPQPSAAAGRSSSSGPSPSSTISSTDFNPLKQKIVSTEYANVLLLSIRSGGFSGTAGLTLTVANHCFMLDPVWNPGLEDQAIARISRIGQKKKTTVYRLIVNNTVEDGVCEIASRKRSKGHMGGKSNGGLFANVKNNDYTTNCILRLFDLQLSDLQPGKTGPPS